MQDKALLTVRSNDGPPTLESAARQLGVSVDAVDVEFGVVAIDPKQGLYSVQIDAAQLPPEPSPELPYRGPYSTPRIEHFGPPETGAPDDDKNSSS